MFLRMYSDARVSERVCWHLSAPFAIRVSFTERQIQQQRMCQLRLRFFFAGKVSVLLPILLKFDKACDRNSTATCSFCRLRLSNRLDGCVP